MVTWTSICVRVCICTADITMSISPEDTMVGSHLNIHVSVIVLVGVSVNKCFIPWSVKEYIILINKNSTSRCIHIRSKIGLVYNMVTVVPTKVKIGVQQRRIIRKVYFLEITRHIFEIALESGILLSIFGRFSILSI
jgi:hypothetical protein